MVASEECSTVSFVYKWLVQHVIVYLLENKFGYSNLFFSTFFVLFNAIFKFIDKCIKLWKITERDKGPVGYNLKDEDGQYRDIDRITSLQVSL